MADHYRDESGQLTYQGARDIIAMGGSVFHPANGALINSLDRMPTEAQWAQGNPRQKADAAQALVQQILSAQQQLAELGMGTMLEGQPSLTPEAEMQAQAENSPPGHGVVESPQAFADAAALRGNQAFAELSTPQGPAIVPPNAPGLATNATPESREPFVSAANPDNKSAVRKAQKEAEKGQQDAENEPAPDADKPSSSRGKAPPPPANGT